MLKSFGGDLVQPRIDMIIYYSFTKALLFVFAYWFIVDIELDLFFASLRDRKLKDNIESMFHSLKDFVFVVDETMTDEC